MVQGRDDSRYGMVLISALKRLRKVAKGGSIARGGGTMREDVLSRGEDGVVGWVQFWALGTGTKFP